MPTKYAKESANVEKQARKLTGMNAQNAKMRFIQMAKSLPSYGSSSFQSKTGQQQFTVGLNGVTVVDSQKGVQKEIQMTHIKRWAVQGNKLVIDTGSADYVYLDAEDANQVSQAIASNIDILLKKRSN